MGDLLGRLDAAIDGNCPCGAPPRDGSAYCSYDCEPTHLSRDSDRSRPGEWGAQSTAARWRPDLVTAHDDSDLVQLTCIPGECPGYTGTRNANIYRRGPEHDRVWHLRLDDGHRFVGRDLAGVPDEALTEVDIPEGEFLTQLRDMWAALERELGNSRHVEHDTDPWADVASGGSAAEAYTRHMDQLLRQYLGTVLAPPPIIPLGERVRWERRCMHCDHRAAPRQGQRVHCQPLDVPSFGIFGDLVPARDLVHDIEPCDLCDHCRTPFPGPPLRARYTRNHMHGSETYRVEIGDAVAERHFLDRTPEDLDRLERQALNEYALLHPDDPDVQSWIRARDARDQRAAMLRWRYSLEARVMTRTITPQSIFRNISTT